jgi:acyl-CoA hydrolase
MSDLAIMLKNGSYTDRAELVPYDFVAPGGECIIDDTPQNRRIYNLPPREILVNSRNANLSFDSNFTIMPQDCNYTQRVVFGGTMLSQLDITAAACVARLMRSSETADSGVTYKVNVTFHKPSHCGDIVFLTSKIVELRKKAIVVKMEAHKEERQSPERTLVATGEFIFVSMKGDRYVHHNLELEND